MPCLLDEERISMLLEDMDNEASHCVFRLADLTSSESVSEISGEDENIKKCLEEARDCLEKFQEKIFQFQTMVVDKDTTEYFEDGAFSNMGWLMISRYLRDGIRVPLELVEQYLSHRTKKDKRVRGAITRLMRQGLISRSKVLVSTIDGICSSDRVEICLSLTDKGMEVCDDTSFVYSPSMTDGLRACNLNTENVLLFRRNKSD